MSATAEDLKQRAAELGIEPSGLDPKEAARAQRMQAEVDEIRAAATSGKGNGPSVIDQYRASMRPEHRTGKGMGGPTAPTPYAPTPALKPENVDHLLPEVLKHDLDANKRPINVRHEREHADVLSLCRSAFDSAYKALEAVSKAREAASANEAWTPAQQLMQVGALSDKHMDRVTAAFDRAHKNLTELVAGYDKTLSSPLEGGADTPRAREIREHVKNLPEAKRGEFVGKALERNDTKTLQAILGAESFLSGLGESHHTYFTRRYRETTNSVVTKKLEIARKGLELLHARAPLIFDEFQRAQGGTFAKIKKLRELSSFAEQALVMQDGTI